MNEKEIQEGNKLIVEILGGKYIGKDRIGGHDYDMYNLPASFPVKLSTPDEFGMKRTGYCGFNSQWDWIIPAWIKLRGLLDPNNEDQGKWLDRLGFALYSASEPSMFFDHIVCALKWYNSLNQPPI